MTIQQIESISYNQSGLVTVSAIIEDAALVYEQTLYDPPEYGPALCEASFELSKEEYISVLPDNDSDLIKYLEDLDLDWIIIDTSDY